MQFIVDGVAYEAASIERITGRLALDLPKQAGLGVQSLARRLEEMSRLGYAPDGSVVILPDDAPGVDPSAVMDSEPHLRALLAFLWLSRRLAGESLTFDEALDFTFSTLEIVDDEDDESEGEAVEDDPTSPPASDHQEPGAEVA